MGWQALENGALLSAAEEAAFDVLLTRDQNVPYPQNLAGRRIALAVLSTNHWPTLRRVGARIATVGALIGAPCAVLQTVGPSLDGGGLQPDQRGPLFPHQSFR
jgi:hypothetical protein